MNFRLAAFLAMSLFTIVACNERIPDDNGARILAVGDSFMAWKSGNKEGIPDYLERELGEEVIDRSVAGSYITRTLPVGAKLGLVIPYQYRAADWEWVILTGGGNDLRFGCGCRRCEKKLDSLISTDGTSGAIPEFVQQIRADGAQVIFVGYLPSPGVVSVVDVCENEGVVLENRLMRIAASDPGVHFLSNANLVPFGDRSFHAEDMIHPSEKTRLNITTRLAAIIRQNSILSVEQ